MIALSQPCIDVIDAAEEKADVTDGTVDSMFVHHQSLCRTRHCCLVPTRQRHYSVYRPGRSIVFIRF
jgi:hypothetical protein